MLLGFGHRQFVFEHLKVFVKDSALCAFEEVPAVLALEMLEDIVVMQADMAAAIADEALLTFQFTKILPALAIKLFSLLEFLLPFHHRLVYLRPSIQGHPNAAQLR